MSRNFYVAKRPATSGEQPLPTSSIAPYTTRRNSEPPAGLSAGPANSRPQQGELSIREFELGSGFLFFAVCVLPLVIVGTTIIIYRAFVL